MISRLYKLDAFLNRCAWLWRAQPFKEPRPTWCKKLPELSATLLDLDEAELERLERDSQALRVLLLPFIPELAALEDLCHLPRREPSARLNEARFGWAVPGRKKAQIEAFSQAITNTHSPVLEWCGGKGHLGRTLALLWQQPVDTVEWDPALCEEGKRLSERAGVRQSFHAEDALDESTVLRAHDRHVVALHACGDLHRQLIHAAEPATVKAIDISPCCYHLGKDQDYHPFNKDLNLRLQRDDLRLAVTNSDTASAAQIRLRNQEMAWKLGYDCLRRQLRPSTPYQNIPPIRKPWLKLDFTAFCAQLAARDSLHLPVDIDWQQIEQQGWQRQREVMRLNLLRFAFRRALEVWLTLDMASHLERQGYAVRVQEFCAQGLTPRNILISARENNGPDHPEKA